MDNNNTTNIPEETHRNFIDVLIDFWITGFDFLKYIFYDVFLGKAP